MGRFVVALLVLAALLVAIVIVAPGLVPVATYRGKIEAAASEKLGRPVTIGEDISFRVFPRVAFHVTDLQIANAEGFEGSYLARVKSADIGVRLFPLFRGAVEVDRFVLTEPDISLQRARDGGVNWNIAQAQDEEAGDGRVRELSLGDVRVIDGKATYTDHEAGRTYEASDVDLSATLKDIRQPLEVDGTMVFQGAPSELNLVLTSLDKLLDKEPANLKLAARLGEAQLGADLVVETKGALTWKGPASLKAPDLPAFAKVLGAKIEEGPGFDTLAVTAVAEGTSGGVRLSDARIDFDKIDATGDVALSWTGERPKLTGRLAAGTLDLRPYLPPPAQDDQGFPEWSEEKIDLSGLRNIDADLNLSAQKIFLNNMEFGESRMRLLLQAGRMVADIAELGLYEGGGTGEFIVNARGAVPTFEGKFDVEAVQAEPFSRDVLSTDRLLGLGGFKFDFTAQGASQAAIMRTMDGAGGFKVEEGALKGVNLAKLARALDDIRKGGLNPAAIANAVATAQSPAEKTDFNELLSQFSIADGLVDSPTISLQGPFLFMTGTGSVNLPAQTLDLRLLPRASTTMDGEGGRSLAIPMRVTGTFSEPKIVVDAEALLRSRLEQGLKDILTRPPKENDAEGASETKSSPLDVIEDVLGVKRERPASDPAPSETPSEPPETGEPQPQKGAFEEALGQIFGAPQSEGASEKNPDEPQ